MGVPQNVLNWMYNVLKGEYHDPDRTYSDVAQTISRYPNLSLRTSVYTYENGQPSLLLNITGTLPTVFRGTTYMFPISIWIPHEYPRGVPMAFATPTANMVLRAGQYVSGEGRIYHPYLAGWREDQSSLPQFISIVQEIFTREPPLIAKQGQPPILRQTRNGDPPPVPPLPPEIERPNSGSSIGPKPPPPPPKQFESRSQPTTQQANEAPPVPPRPTQNSETYGQSTERPHTLYGRPPPPTPGTVPQRGSSLRHSFNPESSRYQDPPVAQWSTRHESHDPRIGGTFHNDLPQPNQEPRYQPQHVSRGSPALSNGHLPPSSSHNLPAPQSLSQQAPSSQQYQQQPYPTQAQFPRQQYLPAQPQTHPPALNPQPKKPPTDLLTSPFDTPLPTTTPRSTGPPPPIPPNPQKDALLSQLSNTLTTLANSAHASNTSALPALTAQQTALSNTLANLNAEISHLEALSSLLSANESILHSSMSAADNVLSEAKTRAIPPIDDVLVAPTRVEGQLYEAVCEERGIVESRAFVGRCLDRGRIGGETWARQTRGLAREEFAKRWLGRKIARGLGLRGVGGLGGEGGGESGAKSGFGGEGWYA